MNRSQKVRKVYAELRNAPGLNISSERILKLAARLVDIYDDRIDLTGLFLDGGRRTFKEYGVDEAISDGGWRILQKEGYWVNDLYDGENQDYSIHQKLRSYGVELAA